MEKIIKAAVDRGASDLHIKAGDVFRARIDGKLVPLTKQRLTPDQTKAIAQRLIANDEDRGRIDKLRDYDCSWGMPGIGRFRVNILRQRSSFMIVMRVIPFDVPTFESLKLPAVLSEVANAERGMILVTGVTGSGKSSTMAAIINHINQNQHRHVLTLENPTKFLHRDINCSVTQREIGVDTDDFRTGLRAALRQDPDVILIGEMRDSETIDTAMKAAETGHLLVSTLHTPDVVTTVSRIVSMFPPEEQAIARVRLSEALHAVVSQRLLPRADGHGRAAALEVMMCTEIARDMIKDQERTSELPDYIGDSREKYGMQTFDQHLIDLVANEIVTPETLLAQGVAGVVVSGSTGEAPLLDSDEQQKLVELAREELRDGKLLIAGTGAESTRQTIALSKAAAAAGADVVLVRAPSYFSAGATLETLATHFRAVADASPVPVLLYNIPKYTHLSLAPVLLQQLANHERIIGVKDSSGDPKNVAAYREAVPQWAVLVGGASLLLTALELRCQGGIVGVACFAPGLCVQLVREFERGDRAAAAALQERITPLDKEIVGKLGPAGVKAAMDAVGLYGGPVRAPLAPISPADRERVSALVRGD